MDRRVVWRPRTHLLALLISFPILGDAGSQAVGPPGRRPDLATSCTPGATTLCIDDQPGDLRFKIEVAWQTVQSGGRSGMGNAVPAAPIGFSQGGIFWFFSRENPEMLVKVLNGCGVNGSYWVFASAGTNVGLQTTVTDTATGAGKVYTNPDLTAALPVQDTSAFSCGSEPPGEVVVSLPGGIPLLLERTPAGTFQMGSPLWEPGRKSDETLHEVTLLSDTFLGRTEVTQGQWRAVVGALPNLSCWGPAPAIGDTFPVYCVSWTEVAGPGGFLEKLNAHLTVTGQQGAGTLRLPTEAEWERAARGGTQTSYSFGETTNEGETCRGNAGADPYVWWCGNASSAPHTVAVKGANPFGLHDVHGNVYEWVSDWYGSYPASPQTDPTGPASGSFRVIRGGAFTDFLVHARSAFRIGVYPPDARYSYIGFRVARSP